MDRKISSAGARIRNFIGGGGGGGGPSSITNNSNNVERRRNRKSGAKSLWNLVGVGGGGGSSSYSHQDTKTSPSSMMMMNPLPPPPPQKSLSMYGLSDKEQGDKKSKNHGEGGGGGGMTTRLLSNIRTRFRKFRKKRDQVGVGDRKDSFVYMKGYHHSCADLRTSTSTRPSLSLQPTTSIDNVFESLLSYGERKPSRGGGGTARVGGEEPVDPPPQSPPPPPTEQYQAVINRYREEALRRRMTINNQDDENIPPPPPPIPTSSSSSIPLPVPPVLHNNTCKTPRSLTKELESLLHQGWYWAGISKEEAEEMLKGQGDGSFLVRDSSSDHYFLSLSFNCNGKTRHTRIEYKNDLFSFYSSDAGSFPTVAELIQHCTTQSEEVGVFCYFRSRRTDVEVPSSYPVKLTTPISRFTKVKSLLYLSRFVIRQYVRLDLIPHLPLPQTLIDYVGEQRYI